MFDNLEITKNILLINDNLNSAQLLRKLLNAKYKCEEITFAELSGNKISYQDYAVVLSNVSLSNMNLPDLIAQIKTALPISEIIVLNGENSAENAVDAFRAGVFDYLQMPLDFQQVEETVERAFEKYELKYLRNDYQNHLEHLAAERAAEIDKVLEEVENSYRITLKALVQALETRDFETHGHSERAVTFSLRLGYELGLDKDALRDLELGALLHDIGKIGVPDSILRKPAKLTEHEWAKMKLHPLHGEKILRNIPFLEGAAKIVCQHHEKWDGSGYPYGLRGEDINFGARIFSVADAFDAMISNRVYRRGRSCREAIEELERCSGTQFDPFVVEAFGSIPQEDWEILSERSKSDKQTVKSFQSLVAELVNTHRQFNMVH